MGSKSITAAAALAALVAAGCGNDASLTAPTSQPAAAAPFALGLASAANLVNPGPLCVGARTPGFYCQNQNGKNPNLTAEEFELLSDEAAAMLGPALGNLTVGEAVCIKGNRAPEDQLVRHLAALALNLAANLVDETTPLTDGSFADVGEAFDQGVATASSADATKRERNAVKDVIDAINNNANTALGEECIDEGDTGGEE
jgi:hypothetical protein